MSPQTVVENQVVEEPESPEIFGVPEQFQVDSDDAANWVVKRITAARAYARRCDEWCEREKARAQREEQFFLWRYGQQLMDWTKAKIQEQGGRRKSVCVPAGMLGFRSEAAKLVVEDEQAVIIWAHANKLKMTSVVERLSKSALNEHVKETGELPDRGVRVESEHEQFYVK